MEEAQKMHICNRCGQKAASLLPVDPGMRLAASASPEGKTESLPKEVCKSCFAELGTHVSKGARLRFEQKAREKNKQMLWKSRINLIRQARAKMSDRSYADAAVAYEKYLRVVEMAYDKPKGTLSPEVFGSTVKSKEITVLATVYWDLMRIYDSHPNYRSKMLLASQKLKQFLPFSRIYSDISKKAGIFLSKSKNHDIVLQFLKDIKATKPKCFIATAAFQAPMAEEVLYLRRFRDKTLANHSLGRHFIRLYYTVSPSIASLIEKSTSLQGLTRQCLRLLIKLITKFS